MRKVKFSNTKISNISLVYKKKSDTDKYKKKRRKKLKMATEFAQKINPISETIKDFNVGDVVATSVINNSNTNKFDSSQLYLQECIDMFDRTLEQVLDVNSTTTLLNANNSKSHLHHDIERSAPPSLSLENFNIKNELFSTYLVDHINELENNNNIRYGF